jgi:hypothetical protein
MFRNENRIQSYVPKLQLVRAGHAIT